MKAALLAAAILFLLAPVHAEAVETDWRLYDQLERHEGMSSRVYPLLGSCMVGIGHKVPCSAKICLGREEAENILRRDVERTAKELDAALPWWRRLSLPRQAVVLNMAFSMGTTAFLRWKQTIQHIKSRQYTRASREMLASLWARQTGGRARELAEQMRLGQWQRTHNAD